MDKQLIARRFAKARNTYSQAAKAQRQVAEKMLHLVSQAHPLPPQRVVEVGCGTGLYSQLLLQAFHPQALTLIDLCPEMEPLIQELLSHPTGGSAPLTHLHFIAGDAEELPLPAGADLITSCSTIQWFEQPARFLQRSADALRPGGLLALSTFGGANLRQIRALTGHGLSYPSLTAWQAMAPPTLTWQHLEEEEVTLWFPSPIEVLRHLKETGVTGTEKQMWSRQRLARFTESYQQQFGTATGQVPLTYHPIYLILKKENL